MATEVKLTLAMARVLRPMLDDPSADHYGLDLMQESGLASGSLYPILRRLETARWVTSRWEAVDPAAAGRPRRRYYALTPEGVRSARLALAELAALGQDGERAARPREDGGRAAGPRLAGGLS